MRTLYPPINPYHQGYLSVSPLHTLYYEEVGNPYGKPIVLLHGGPGSRIEPLHRQFFDPQRWRIILFDQRGCGQSTPYSELRENTTWDLVQDIELLRQKLGIEQWVVFGGSWGSTLALAYAQTHPNRCNGLILRGIFLMRQKELLWFYQEGASYIFPDLWEQFIAPIPPDERHNLIQAYHHRLNSKNKQVRLEAAMAWCLWEAGTSRLFSDPKLIENSILEQFADAFARIENHYFVNKGFLHHENQLLENVDKIRHIPAVIIQGRYDIVCPMTSAWELHRAWYEAEFCIIADAGHAATETGILSALVEATDHFASL